MPRKRSTRTLQRTPNDLAAVNYGLGRGIVGGHPVFSRLFWHTTIYRHPNNRCPYDGWAVVTSTGEIHVNPVRLAEPEEWAYVLAHCLLHLGFGHVREQPWAHEWNAACDVFIARFLDVLKLGRPPVDVMHGALPSATSEERIYELFCASGLPNPLPAAGTAGPDVPDMIVERERGPEKPIPWHEYLAHGLAAGVRSAVEVAAGQAPALGVEPDPKSPAERARSWFVGSYPLLGALAAAFRIIEDLDLCHRLDIAVAAVNVETREIYLNPLAGLDEQECRFVIAHELLHVGLRHDARRQGREPYLWNCACDYVINGWLIEMGVGTMPRSGVLYDPTLAGWSAEAIYDLIVRDLRRMRKLATLRGTGLGDMLEPGLPDWWKVGDGVRLDDFYRSSLSQGLVYHQNQGRGFLPAALIEEIYALAQPPIPWDVKLARWFDHHFPPVELRRSYGRPSRHQSATPDVPRPRWVYPDDWRDGRTFGVVLDTSGSMERSVLARALGAIASYSLAREVPAARVVFCDAAAYDQGYLPPEAIAERVRVKGRGGTVLQPAINLLERAEDFPTDGPLLIITDGRCDVLRVRREHAFLLPRGRSLPFVPRGEVFTIEE